MLSLLLGAAALGYGGILAGLFFGQRRLLYRPGTARPELGELAALGVRETELATADGLALLAWYRPAPAGRPVLVYFHGNGGHIGHRSERLRRFAGEGFSVLMPEYRGYGGNPGRPNEAGLYADGRAALDFLAEAGVPPQQIVLWGESLGSGVAVRMAAERPVGGVVLEAPFTSVAAVAQCHYPFVPAARMVQDRFDSLAVIGRVAAPILFLHGERDRVVPIQFGRALFEAAASPKEAWVSPQAGHVNLARYGALDVAIGFIEGLAVGPSRELVAAGANFD